MSEFWTAKPHQKSIALKEALPILKQYMIVYLAMEERTGKTITALEIVENCNINNCLIITTKKAMDGWQETLVKYKHKKHYTLINYNSVHKIKDKFDIVILDESHKFISSVPKVSSTWLNVFKHTFGVPIIYCSATPYPEGPQQLFHQLKLSKWSPWRKYNSFYDWYNIYAKFENGQLPLVRINANNKAVDYKKADMKCLNDVKHLFISYTRKQLGFKHEPEDVLHFIDLLPLIKNIYNTIVKKKLLVFDHAESGNTYKLVCDNPSKLRWALHMIEGGILKIEEDYVVLGNTEKIDYILKTWGDTKDLVIMYYFKGDKIKLERYFKNARLLQAQTNAEGVDLHKYKHLVIYSQNHSAGQHTQRRARQANMNRNEEIKVHYLLTKGAASHKAYKQVSIKKQNFVDTVFEEI